MPSIRINPRRFVTSCFVCSSLLLAPGIALAAGSESGPAPTDPPISSVKPPAKPGAPAGPVTTVAPSLYEQGKVALSNGNYKLAASLFTQVTTSQPGNADAWNLLGFSTRKGGNPKGSIAFYDRALKLNPKHLGALEYQGEAFMQLGQIAKAKANLKRLKSVCGTNCEEYKDLAKVIAATK